MRVSTRRGARSYLIFSVLFLCAALLWTRVPGARPWVRHLWAVTLLLLAVIDFASGLRRISRDRDLPAWTWLVASAAYGLAGAVAVAVLSWQR